MIHFIPKNEYKGLPALQGAAAGSVADFSDPTGRRGHVINIGKEYICVFNFEDEYFPGSDSALMIAGKAAGCGIAMPEGDEEFAALRATQNGLLRVDEEKLRSIQDIASVRIITLNNNEFVQKGQMVASVRITSRLAGEDLEKIEKLCHGCRPVIDVRPILGTEAGA